MDVVMEALESKTVAVAEAAPPADDWGALVRRHEEALRRRVWRTFGLLGVRARQELVEEVIQEVYCRLLDGGAARLRRCRAASDRGLGAYLGTIAERVVLDNARLSWAVKRSGLRVTAISRQVLEGVPDPGPSPEEHAVGSERRRQFLSRCRTLRGLGSGRRNAWVMRMALLEGYSSREIARQAGGRLTPRGVDLLVHRIRRRLARQGVEVRRR